MTTEVPKHELLRKLLKMTSSSNDGEALTAIRKANELLKSAAWDWDKLLDGKIKVAADPFANLGTPHNPSMGAPPPPSARRPAPPPPPQPAPRPRPHQPPPRPQPQPQPAAPFEPWSHRSTNGQANIYQGNCYCCGIMLDARDGKLFKPKDFNRSAPDGKKPICLKCDGDKFTFIDSRPAPKTGRPTYTGPAPTAGDL